VPPVPPETLAAGARAEQLTASRVGYYRCRPRRDRRM
jgi:hypothetical protein